MRLDPNMMLALLEGAMPKVAKVKIEDLVAASRRYVDAQLKKADVNRSKVLTRTEANRLAKDLQDNFDVSHFKLPGGSVRAADLAKEFVVMMEAWAHASDKNHDGYLSTAEAKALPKDLRDNFASYLSTQTKADATHGAYTTHDSTPRARIQEHLAAFGTHAIGYEQAFAVAIEAVATDAESGLPFFVKEFGGPDGNGLSDAKKLEAEVRSLLRAGSMELLPKGQEIPTGEQNKDGWIFRVSTGGQGDHGLWAIVDRRSGAASVTNFN